MTGRGAALARLAREANRFLADRLDRIGLGTGEHPFLLALADHPDSSQEDLCRILEVDRAHTARTLARLEARGLVVRNDDPQDARKRRVGLTDAGRRQVPAVVEALEAWEAELERRLGSEDAKALDRILARLASGVTPLEGHRG